MSEHYQVVTVSLNVFREEVVQLDEVMGRVPSEEIVEVLNSEWAKQEGWKREVENQVYSLRLPNEVSMQIRIGEQGEVRLARKAQGATQAYGHDSESARQALRPLLDQQIAGVEEEYNRKFNELVGRAFVLALPKWAKESGCKVLEQHETFNDQAHTIDLEMKIYLQEEAF